jgi:4-amino-4-deoxy-L-arabinose transferase-like glycosyltransferase
MSDGSAPGAVQRASATLAVMSALWTLWLLVSDGMSVTVLGLRIRSHDPVRPAAMALAAVAVFFLTGGRSTLSQWYTQLAPKDGVARRTVVQWWHTGLLQHVLAGALTLAILLVGILRGSTAAGGADSYGYLSEAELWRSGRLAIEQPWVKDVPWPNAAWSFSPLGYTPSRPVRFNIGGYAPAAHDRASIVPMYSPGLPLLMALGKAIGGVCGPFFIVPLGGALLIASTYLLGVRLGSSTLGLLAAVLLATSAPFLLMHFVNMTDVPVAGAFAFACWCVLGTTMSSALGGAMALAVALLIRPNLVPLVPVVMLWLAWRVVRQRSQRWHHSWRAVIVLGGAAAASLATSAIYWTTYGTPFESGYGATAAYFALSHVPPNAYNYTQWFSDAHTPVGFLGLLALALPVKRLWPDVVDRSVIAMFALLTGLVIAEFLYYLVFDNPSYLRFFLVWYPFLMLGLATLSLCVGRLHRVAGPPAAALLVVGLVVKGQLVSADWSVFDQHLLEAKYADVAEHVKGMTPENSVVLAMIHSGSLRYFAGRVTLRWDQLPPDWLDRGVAWMAARGVRTYALLDNFELDQTVKQFKGQELVEVLEGPPIFRFGNKVFFDLGLKPGTQVDTIEFPVVDRPSRCWVPAEPPQLHWK